MRLYKLLILPVLLAPFAVTEVAHAGACAPKSYDSGKDEYLYPGGLGGAYCCGCSDDEGCNNGAKVTAKDAKVDGTVYDEGSGFTAWVCDVHGGLNNTLWKKVELNDCTDPIRSRLKDDPAAQPDLHNPDGKINRNNFSSVYTVGNRVCLKYVCQDGYKEITSPDQLKGKCIPETSDETWNSDPTPTPDQKKKGGKTGGGSGGGSGCLDRPTAEGRACCRAKGATKWKDNVCICTDITKEWKYTEGQEYGQCITKGSTEVVNPCDAICTNYISIVVDNCAMQKVNNYASVVANISQQCANRATCDAKKVTEWVNQVEVAVANCSVSDVPDASKVDTKRLAEAVAALDKYRSGLDVSVWKDAEGNFNTARLVSDSIAGVVLGTAGGLITSSVVKKNQVKSGFEDVVCTIGGQEVGSYGDEISVGIQ